MVNHRLRELRIKSKYSGPFVAEKLGISSAYYYELERGEKRLNENLIRLAAEFYGVSTDYLLKIESDNDVIAAHFRGEKGDDLEGLEIIIKEFGEKYEVWRQSRKK